MVVPGLWRDNISARLYVDLGRTIRLQRMKKYTHIVAASALAMSLVAVGCDDGGNKKKEDVAPEAQLSVSADTLRAPNSGGTYTIEVSANVAVEAIAADSWLTVNVGDGTPTTISIEVGKYVADKETLTGFGPRSSSITITAGDKNAKIVVRQSAEDLLMYDNDTYINSVGQAWHPNYEGGELLVGFQTNGDYKVSYPWWIVPGSVERTPVQGNEFVHSVKARFNVLMNFSDKQRNDSIVFTLGTERFSSKIVEDATQFDFSGVRRTANEIAQSMKWGWNMTDAHENRDANVSALTEWMLDSLTSLGVNVVRLTCPFVDDDGALNEFRVGAMKALAESVAQTGRSTDGEAFAIVSMDVDGWLADKVARGDTAALFDTYARTWNRIATELILQDDHVLFEAYDHLSVSELGAEALPIMRRLNEIFVQTVRRNGGNNYKRSLVIPIDGESGATVEMPTNDVVADRLLASFRFFRPADFAWYDATKSLWGEPFKSGVDWSSSCDEEAVRRHFSDLLSRIPNGLPTLMSAFGTISHSETDSLTIGSEAYYANTVAKSAHDNGGIVPIVFDDNNFERGHFGVFRRDQGNFLSRREYADAIDKGSRGEQYAVPESEGQ